MKKTLLLVATLASISSFALGGGYNLYVKGGIVYGNGDKLKESVVDFGNEVVKNVSPIVNAFSGNMKTGSFKDYITDENIPNIKEGMEVFKENILSKSKNKINGTVSLEVTKDVTNNLELGVGISYIYNTKREVKLSNKDIAKIGKESLDSKVKKLENKESMGEIFYKKITTEGSGLKLDLVEPKYDIIPIYFTAKYNFKGLHKDLIPYAKVDLGYAIPVNVKGLNADFGNLKQGDSKFLQILSNFGKSAIESLKTTATGGVYVGAAAGVEYKRFLAELGVTYIGGKIKYASGNITSETNTSDVQMMLKFGYRF